MADEKKPKDENEDAFGDSGLGNLPPLSDFDSEGGFGSESGLPPLASFDSTPEESGLSGNDSGSAGLPPISDLDVETPMPTAGMGTPSPAGFDSGGSDTFSTGGSAFDTPVGDFESAASGFQDMAADSDFSPETPEIGPGPDSNVDTPMFDSAFGGADDSDFDVGVSTPAPTQAMETPMFGGGGDSSGGGGGGFGFDDGAFDAGTPAPDFSPDTDIQRATLDAAMAGQDAMRAKQERAGGAKSKMAALLLAVIALLIGFAVRPFIPGEEILPNPKHQMLQDAQAANQQLKKDLEQMQRINQDGQTVLSPEEVQRMRDEMEALVSQIADRNSDLEALLSKIQEQQASLDLINQDIEAKGEEFLSAQEQFEDLQNETAIIQARQRGLVSEVDRLTSLVGELEDANVRRAASKDALAHAVDLLYITIKESMPLTPEHYAYQDRVARVETLREQLASAKWVTPALMDAYTAIYVDELEISARQEYFFAKLPVTDQFGTRVHKYSECLMLGNHAVQYRSFDGKNIGIYTNMSTTKSPEWAFNEDLPDALKKEIENTIISSRVDGFAEKVQFLAEKELAGEEGNKFQQAFSSL